MTSLDLSGIITRVCSDLKSRFDSRYQASLTSGVNIKTINSTSLLGSGDISISSSKTWYGTCGTGASTAAKTVTCSGFTLGALETGVIVSVYFTSGNSTVGNPTLNVNNTGAKRITAYGAVSANTTYNQYHLKWDPYCMVTFVYTGSTWAILSKSNMFFTLYGTSSSGDTASTKTVSWQGSATNYPTDVKVGQMFAVRFANANTFAGLLVVRGNVYYKGAATSASNPLYWNAGDTLLFYYDGTYTWYIMGSTAYGYTLPTASSSTLGGVKVGNGLAIDANGVLSLDVSSANGVSF